MAEPPSPDDLRRLLAEGFAQAVSRRRVDMTGSGD